MILALLLLLHCLGAGAQEFVTLTPDEVRIDTVLPFYSCRMAGAWRDVRIEYPEFVPLTRKEVRCYRRLSGNAPLGRLPEVEQHVSIARRQAVTEVAFVPLVYRDGRYQKLVSFRLVGDTLSIQGSGSRVSTRSTATTYADHSVLREGTWVKIRIPATGFYQLTDELIRRAGFSDPSRVHLYGYGGALQPEVLTQQYLAETDDMQEVPTCTIGGRRLFYGIGPVNWEAATTAERTRNPYSDYGYYFLTDQGDQSPLTIAEADFRAAHYPAPADYHSLYEQDDYAWYHGGRNLYDKTLFTTQQSRTYKLQANGSAATLSVTLSYDASFTATIALNDSTLGTVSRAPVLDSYTEAEARTWDFDLPATRSGENTVSITQTTGGNLRLDHLSLMLSDPMPLPDLATASLPVPEYVYQITNQDHHADETADMIILIPTRQQTLQQAERLKAHHEATDGLRVRIVPADELYNEFSSGTPDATAYRRYMKMLYDRAASEADMPRYLLLFGDGAWDNRMRCEEWTGYDPDDFLLCYESDNSFSHVYCYVSDDFFCLLDDGEAIQSGTRYLGKPDVAVGRLSARTADEARVLVDKILAYAQGDHAGSWQNTICVMGDDGNGNTHMQTADRVATLVEQNYPGYQLKKIYWDAYQRTSSATGYSYPEVTRQIKQQLTDGALMMNYCGHGANYALSHELVMKLADFDASVTDRYPLWVTASCDIMPFDGQDDNIGETVMMSEKGGGVAFFGTTRTVYANYNEAMNLAFTDYVLNPELTIGEAARLAKCDLVDLGRDTSPNKLQYTLLGDPALRLATPRLRVVVDSIGSGDGSLIPFGQQIGSENRPLIRQLAAGEVACISGHVEQASQPLDSYHGIVTATVRDAEELITCRLNDTSSEGADVAFEYTDRTRTIYHGSDSIRNGRFLLTFAVPKDISYDDGTGLLTLFAIDDSHQLTGHGEDASFVLSGSGVAAADSIGPSVYCYLNSRSFSNGDVVGSTPYFMAELYDESGINASGSSVGHDMELVIDGQQMLTYTLNDYFQYDFGDYRSGRIGFSIPELAEGQHRLQFRAWDVMNNSTVAQLDFRVAADYSPDQLSVVCTHNPATTTTGFIVSHGQTGADVEVTLDVFDMSGRQLYKQVQTAASADGTSRIDWDLRLSGGSRLRTGVYVCRLSVGSASKANKLIVLGNN